MAISRTARGGAEVGRSRFRSVEPVLLSVLPELRWTTISGGPEFFVDANQGRAKLLNQLRQHLQQLLRPMQKLNRAGL